jgi:cysteinyl-tRNA synthetase
MKLYNTLTRQTDTLKPIHPDTVSVYTCGPTVYDYAHIGHWYTYVRMDTLIRSLRLDGLEPNWVMNITDVGHLVSDADDGEDKLEKGARREGKTAWEVAQFYTDDFMTCMELLSISHPDHITKATDHIQEQIALVQTLEAKGYTYIIDDGVYYDTSKFEGYASFARLDLEEQQASGRVQVNTQKRQAADFALWKFSPANETRDMEWDSPWGKGFPGWHIECSAMSMKYLGETLDIHTGGIDHIPVHHTNEIAQSEAATGKRFANHWLHSNHVTVNSEKISKSLGNGIRLQAIIEKGIPAEAVRLHILESHYRSQSRFSWDSLEAAHNRLKHWQAVAALYWQPQREHGESLTDTIVNATTTITEQLTNDLSTPQALSQVDEVFSTIETKQLDHGSQSIYKDFLDFIDRALGINLLADGNLDEEQLTIFQERSIARANQDWQASDILRDHLLKLGIGVNDTSDGQIWYRI